MKMSRFEVSNNLCHISIAHLLGNNKKIYDFNEILTKMVLLKRYHREELKTQRHYTSEIFSFRDVRHTISHN